MEAVRPRRISRRRFILSTGSIIPAQLCLARFATAQSDEAAMPDVSTEDWMNGWMETKGLSGPLHLSRFVEPIYFLLKPISWSPSADSGATFQPVTAPIGFVTDLASVPRAFFSLLRPDAEYAYAAILHDYLYWTQSRERDEADEIFKFAMQDLEVKPRIVSAVYRAVRTFGKSAWAENVKLREKGEKRFLQKFPEDPTTYWRDWKLRADVFT